ncbi:MAG: hypothetical protein PHQ74_12085 [Crocinitomicaceae bacterium]|nr:hypothetical protein [Crocinitomicaceae bacterium]
MSKSLILILLAIFSLSSTQAQQLYNSKKKRKNYFGKKENPNDKVRPFGLQVQLGPTYTFTNRKNETFSTQDSASRNFNYTHDPKGKLGVFAEIGFVHFNMKDPKYKFGRIIDYIDYGVGFKLYGGRETTTIDILDSVGSIATTATGEGEFYNGYAHARFAVHKIQYLNKTKNIFLDHSLGLNADLMVLIGNKDYKAPVLANTQRFDDPLSIKLHYDIGFGIRLKKGQYLVPGVQLPLIGIHAWDKGNPSINWYSSKYYPALFHVKYIYLFKAKKSKNQCYEGDAAGKKQNEEYMQNR